MKTAHRKAAKHKRKWQKDPAAMGRDTLTKRPDFPKPAVRLSQRLVRWSVVDADKYFSKTAGKRAEREAAR